jgi:hypothetical protein
MPYIVIKTCFPNERATEAAKKYLEVVEKYPPDETIAKVILDSAIDADENGLHGLSIIEPQGGKLEEALKRTETIMVEYLSVPDYRWEIKIWSTPEEALKYIGMG